MFTPASWFKNGLIYQRHVRGLSQLFMQNFQLRNIIILMFHTAGGVAL